MRTPPAQAGLFDALDDLEHGEGQVAPTAPSLFVPVVVRLFVRTTGGMREAEGYRRSWRFRTPAVEAYVSLLCRTRVHEGTTVVIEESGVVAEHRTREHDGWRVVDER